MVGENLEDNVIALDFGKTDDPAEESQTSEGDMVHVDALHSALESKIDEARESYYRLARYNFKLTHSSGEYGHPRDLVCLEQLQPWLPHEKPYGQKFLHLGEIFFWGDEEELTQSLSFVSRLDQPFGIFRENRMNFVNPSNVRLVLANLRDVIRMFEESGNSVSVQGLAYITNFLRIKKGERLGSPIVTLPEVYRSHSRMEQPVKDALERVIGDMKPSVMYRL
ncbi:MAG: hypothetical protein KJ574_03390 [Nanoarchaeota archaeon]|nr:hypothetical protein [Nanoarchaeota archaeon]